MDSEKKDVAAVVERLLTTKCPHCDIEIDVSELAPFSHAECPHCAKTLVVPARLGPFLLLDVIGAGGMGGVYRAVDQTLGRSVAIKVMLSSLGTDREFVETFKREAQAAAKLNHPHIAQIYSFGEEKGQPYIVMELVDGRGLDKLIESGKSLDQGLIMQIGLDIAEGLHEADQIGLVHGDIKPENILLDEKMNGKLVDFGIASFADQGASEGIWGTPYYIAPEKLRRQPVDARSDIYSLGATLFHALTGHPPFEGETPIEVVKARLEHEPPPLHELREDIDEEIERIIARMLRMEPSNRYPTYSSLISDIRKVVQTMKPDREKGLKSKKIRIRKKGSGMIVGPGSSPVTGSLPKVSSSKRKPTEEDKQRKKSAVKKLVWTLVILVLLLAAAGAGIFLKIRHDKEIAARRLYLALMAAHQNAESAYGQVALAATNLVKRAAAAEPFVVQATNMASIVTEQSAADLVQWLDRETPRFDPAALEAAEKEAAEKAAAEKEAAKVAETSAAPSTNAAPGEAAATATNGAPAAAEAATNATEVATNATEVAAAGTNAAAPAAVASTNAVVATAVEPPAPEVAKPAPVVNEPEIRILARDVLSDVLQVRSAAVDARRIAYEADRVRQAAVASRRPAEAESKVTDLKAMQESLTQKKTEIEKAFERAVMLLKRMDLIKGRTLRNRAEQEKARIEQERKQREEDEKRQREQAHEDEVAREMVRVNAAAEDVKPLLRKHEYEAAMREVSRQQRDLNTDEAKDAMQVYVDRYDRLHKLVMFLIDQLNKDPFKWGWIQGASPEDIIGANITHVKLRGRIVPWQDVSTRQMVYFIRHYITRSNQSVTLMELGNQALASAIFCYENGGYDAAAMYKEKALEFHARLRKDADRLVPDEAPAGAE